MKKLLLFAFFLGLLPFLSFGQFNLSGRITDQTTGEPLSGAGIILENTYITAISSEDGTFIIKALKPGNYALKVSFVGYEAFIQKIDLVKDISLDIAMKSSSILGSEVIVTATRAAANTPATYSTVTCKEIEKVNLGQDMPFLLQSSPSMVSTSDAGTGIGYTSFRIRGTDLTRINVTIDGVPLNDAESQGVWWVDLPDAGSSVESIQIQRGVGTSTNGAGAFGASVNIRSNDPEADPYAEVNVSGGSFLTGKLTLKAGTGLIKNRWAFDGRYSRIWSDGYIDRAWSNLSSLALSGGYFGAKNIVRLMVFSGNEVTYQAWDGVPGYMLDTNRTYNGLGAYYNVDGQLEYYPDQTDNYRQTHYHLSWITNPAENWNLSTALYYTRGLGYYEEYKMDQPFSDYNLPDAIIGNDTIISTDLIQQRWLDNYFYGLTFGLNYDNHKDLSLIIGGDANYYDGNHYGEIIWSRIATQYDEGYKWYFGTGYKSEASLFAKASWQVLEKLNLYGDLQYRYIFYNIHGTDNDLRNITQQHTYSFFNPKLGAYYELNDRNQAYLSFGIGHREPTRSTLIDANPSQPSPTFETLYNTELGYKFDTRSISINANLYYMYYHDQLVLTGQINDVGDPVMQNVPKSYRTGLEVELGFRLTKNLTWNLNGTFSTNRILNFTEYVDDWDNWPDQIVNELGTTTIAFSPAVIAGSILQWEPVKKLSLSIYSKYVGKQYIDNTSSNDRKLDPYFINDFVASYYFSFKTLKQLGLSLKVNNFTNAMYESNAWVYRYYSEGSYGVYDGFYPQAGINFLVGADFQF